MIRSRVMRSACKKRIPNSEPDLVLQKLGSEMQRRYHQRCIGAARRVVVRDPAVWHLTNRYMDEGPMWRKIGDGGVRREFVHQSEAA